jgi:hypothetical protein
MAASLPRWLTLLITVELQPTVSAVMLMAMFGLAQDLECKSLHQMETPSALFVYRKFARMFASVAPNVIDFS